MDRRCEIVIIIPSLDPLRAGMTAEEARKTAGIKCGILIASDQEKRGAVIASNILFEAAIEWGAKYICYLNDDTSNFPEGWLKRLVQAVRHKPEYADASAGGKCRGGPQREGKPGLPEGIVETKHPLAWFCTVIKTSALINIGPFDPNLTHYADDSDWSFRATDEGWLHVYVPDVYVTHQPGDPIEPWWSQDLARLRMKHPEKLR